MDFRPYYLAKEWVRLGHEVTIVAASYSHLRSKQPAVIEGLCSDLIDGIDYRWIKTRHYDMNGIGRFLNIAQFIYGLFKNSSYLAQRVAPDVVIASSTYPMDIWPARLIAKKAKAKLVFELHDVWPQFLVEVGGLHALHPFVLLTAIAERAVYNSADKIVSMLPAIHGHCKKRGYNIANVTVIPNGISLSDWDSQETLRLPVNIDDIIQKAKTNNQRIVCYTGAHGIPNDLDNLLDAASLVTELPVIFLLVGDGHHRTQLVERVKREKLHNVHMVRSVSKQMIPRILEAIDITFIGAKKQPLYQHGISPNKMVDYMMSARPIISAIAAGNDPVGDAKCGLTVEPDNPQALAIAIRTLSMLNDEELYAYGASGKTYVEENYIYDVLASRFLGAIAD